MEDMRRVFSRLVLLATLAACNPGPRHVARAPVVLISIDTLRADRLPTYGYHGVTTPNLDALAADSAVFERALSHVPQTLPSHATLFTGQLPPTTGIRDNLGFRLPEDSPTLASRLRSAGMPAISSTGLSRGSSLTSAPMASSRSPCVLRWTVIEFTSMKGIGR